MTPVADAGPLLAGHVLSSHTVTVPLAEAAGRAPREGAGPTATCRVASAQRTGDPAG